MSLSWPIKKILSKIGVNLHLNTLALFFWWFSFLILSQVLCLKLNCHIYIKVKMVCHMEAPMLLF